MNNESDMALVLVPRGDGSYEPLLTGDTLKDDIFWTDDIIFPHEDEVPVHFEGVTRKLPVIRSQPSGREPSYYVAHSVAWRFINEIRDAAQKSPRESN
jgi:hypothetical protein